MDVGYLTLDACLRDRALQTPDKRVYAFLDENGGIAASLSYNQLHLRALTIAQSLRTHAPAGSRVMLLFWPGLDFAEALFGCFYAGMVAVPAYPPEPARVDRTIARLRAIATDSTPAVVLTSSSIHTMAKPLLAFAPDFGKLPWLAVDTLANDVPPTEPAAERAPHDLAIIQYTSGSTAKPKGVMVSHRNILANMRMIQIGTQQDEHRTIVSWLPTYHDLGLMCGMVLPVTLGASAILMSPLDFLRRPSLWLSTISEHRATDTFAPNFALDLAVRKITGAEREALDLSSLKACIIGAEPVRHASIERFIQAFGKRGFARDSMGPCYGLAEAVVAVSGGPIGESPRSLFVDAHALGAHRFVEVGPTHPDAQAIVSCGRPLTDLDVAIVDPNTLHAASPGEIGEVWIRGPSVALGYWQRDLDHQATFEARMTGDAEQTWLRTGDLGCFDAGRLYITGRIKDLIIVRGKNHYPQDIELTVERSHPRVRPGATIAFASEQDGGEQLVVVAEVDTRQLYSGTEKDEALHQVVTAIREALHAEHTLQALSIVLIKARTIDKTSSGKLARQNCKRRFIQGKLEAELAWTMTSTPARSPDVADEHETSTKDTHRSRQWAQTERRHEMARHLGEEIARLASTGHTALAPETKLADLGLDSLGAMELLGYIEQAYGVTLAINTLLGSTTLAELIAHIERQDFRVAGNGVREAGDSAAAAPIGQTRGTLGIALRHWHAPSPLFCIGGLGGTVSYLSHLGQALGDSRPCIAFQAAGIDGAEIPLGSVEEMARRYIDEMRAIQPRGPYAIAGHSFGGLVAYEMAQQLAEQGESVAPLLLLDTSPAEIEAPVDSDDEVVALFELSNMYRRLAGDGRESETLVTLEALPIEEQRRALRQTLGVSAAADHVLAVYRASHAAMTRYRPRPYQGPVHLFLAERGFPQQAIHPNRHMHHRFGTAALGWDQLCPALQVIKVPGDHFTLVMPPHVRRLADALQHVFEPSVHMEIGLERLLPASGRRSHGRALEITPDGIRFDPHHPAYIEHPYPFLSQLREQTPIYRDAMSIWWVTRYADVSAGLRSRSFSVDARQLGDEPQHIAEGSAKPSLLSHWFRHQESAPLARLYNHFMLFVDPPKHTLLRKAFASFFSPEAVQKLVPAMDERIHELITDMRTRRDPDLIRDLALPLPISVISAMFGVPREDSPFIAQWARDLSLGLDTAISNRSLEQANRSAENFNRYLVEHVTRQQKTPKATRRSLLDVDAVLQSGLSMDELIANMAMSYFAGFETTTNTIGNGTLALLRHPDQWARLRENPSLCENAVEELLRYDCPVRYASRYALEDVEIGGHRIQRGDAVMFMLSSANHDPAVFPDPDRLDLGRNARQHVAFSHGLHYCLGASLARIELQRVFLALSQQRFSMVPGSLVWRDSLNFRSLEQLRIAWVN